MTGYFIKALRAVKNYFASPRTPFRKIHFGLARGFSLPMSRRSQLRMEFGLFERPVKHYVKEFSRGAFVAYDVGAAEGYYVLAFAQCLGIGAKIYAFEPDLPWVKHLEEVIRYNKLSNRVEIIGEYIGSAFADHDEVSLDALIKNRQLPLPDVLKIDIEGAELRALRGMESILRSRRPKIILETHSRKLKLDCRAFLEKIGYAVDDVPFGWFEKVFPEFRAPPSENSWLVAY